MHYNVATAACYRTAVAVPRKLQLRVVAYYADTQVNLVRLRSKSVLVRNTMG